MQLAVPISTGTALVFTELHDISYISLALIEYSNQNFKMSSCNLSLSWVIYILLYTWHLSYGVSNSP